MGAPDRASIGRAGACSEWSCCHAFARFPPLACRASASALSWDLSGGSMLTTIPVFSVALHIACEFAQSLSCILPLESLYSEDLLEKCLVLATMTLLFVSPDRGNYRLTESSMS